VLTGGHTSDRLRAAGATHLVDGIAQLPGLLVGSNASGAAGSVGGDAVPAGGARAGSAPGAPTGPPPTWAPSAASTSAPRPQVPLERRNSGL
jgi:hypothetical protein